jgi:hypothetical protein
VRGPLAIVLEQRFGYGANRPFIRKDSADVTFPAGPDTLRLAFRPIGAHQNRWRCFRNSNWRFAHQSIKSNSLTAATHWELQRFVIRRQHFFVY